MQDELRAWDAVLSAREAVNLVLDKARVEKFLGASLEAKVLLHVTDPAAAKALAALQAAGNGADELRYLLIASQVWWRMQRFFLQVLGR